MAKKLTSYDNETVGSGSIVNEVALTYNSFGQIVTDAQSHSGAVVPGTTPQVQYAYANGSSNMIRPTTLTYPNARAITISYGTSGGINDSASRVDALVDGATTLVNYTYLGLGVPVQTTYPQPSIQHTLLGSSGGNSPAGDVYWGLDNFGRIIDSRWYNTGSGIDVDRIKYGYDRASNRIWRQNPVATAASAKFDEIYRNDGLQRLKDMQRGTLNGSNTAVTSPTFGQCWTLDPTGNWRGFNESTNGSSWTLTQTRTSNPVNEITGITNTVGSAWAATAYDAAGNMTSMPRPATLVNGYTAIYDAWNRLVAVKAGASFVQQNQYDARNFRTVILPYSGGVLSETRHSYFTTGWRCIEERVDAGTTAERQFVWGVRYIDDLVERDRDTTGGGTLNQRMYAHQDANWNMSAITTTAGVVGERYSHSPYGRPTFLTSTFGSRSASSYAWETLYCGYRFDAGTNLFSVRFRSYHPVLGSWCQRDPIRYLSGANLLQYASSRPGIGIDPFGLIASLAAAGVGGLVGGAFGGVFAVGSGLINGDLTWGKFAGGVGGGAAGGAVTGGLLGTATGDPSFVLLLGAGAAGGAVGGAAAYTLENSVDGKPIRGDDLLIQTTAGAVGGAALVPAGHYGGKFVAQTIRGRLSAGVKPCTSAPPNNVAVREHYLKTLEGIPGKIDSSLDIRQQAIRAFELRNAAKIQARAMMTDRKAAALLDQTDPIMTLPDFVRKVYDNGRGPVGDALWEAILKSSTRSRASVNQALGLGNK